MVETCAERDVQSNGTLTDYAYIAGLLDADGTICMHRINPGKSWESCNFIVDIVNKDLQVLQWVQSLFGGFIRERKYNRKKKEAKNWQVIYDWVAEVSTFEFFLMSILPFMRIKRRQAELALMFRKTSLDYRKNFRLTSEQKQHREVIYAEMKKLNKPNYQTVPILSKEVM